MTREPHIQNEPWVSIIVVNWNGLELLDDCLGSLAAQTWEHKEFILVDNASTDGSRDLLISWADRLPNAQTILLPTNTGFCVANNIAFTRARGEWIALFNPDAVADPRWLEELVKGGDPTKRIGMLASKILFRHAANVIDKAGHLIYWDGQNRGRGTMETDCGQYDTACETLWPDGCAALYHRAVFQETGGFDEMFFGYADDADLGMRARLLGWKAWYVPSAIVQHRHSAIFGVYSPLKVMLIERNRLLLVIKNFPLSLLVQNPFWTMKRLTWIAYALLSQKGAAARFVDENGWRQTAFNLLWSYFSALKYLRYAFRQRRQIQRSKRVSNAETMEFLSRFQIDIRELTFRD